jgi:hypothetical protein
MSLPASAAPDTVEAQVVTVTGRPCPLVPARRGPRVSSTTGSRPLVLLVCRRHVDLLRVSSAVCHSCC